MRCLTNTMLVGGPFYAATGNGQSMLSNRVSWFFDLRGPSFTIDTACSSSLYAIHLACQSLRAGETTQAIVGGTNLIYDLSYMRDMVTMTFFSPDGVCHSFDHRANGYARGDGIGGVMLNTFRQALADGDTIRAVIRGTGLNQDGKTPGITMPSPEAQADLIRSTYASAGLSMENTAYFEAHGTGTAIGDPYELASLGATFGKVRTAENPIYVGSVKTNIGHLEGCAGLAGLIKTVLVLENGAIPPLAGFEKANPRLKLDEWHVALPTELIPWPDHGLRRASVNSFGYGGANAHVIVDDAEHFLKQYRVQGRLHIGASSTSSDDGSDFSVVPTPLAEASDPLNDDGAGPEHKLFVFSTADQAGLQRVATAYSNYLGEESTSFELPS
jgi:acyl transferase domain-containing protein